MKQRHQHQQQISTRLHFTHVSTKACVDVEIVQKKYITSFTLSTADVPLIKQFNTLMFPVRYQQRFYDNLFLDNVYSITIKSQPPSLFSSATIIAMVTARINNLNGYIMTLGVLQSYRGSGLGSFLVKSICEILSSKGVKSIELDVLCDNHQAIRLYMNNGFHVTHTNRNYYEIHGQLHDAYHMIKHLTQLVGDNDEQ